MRWGHLYRWFIIPVGLDAGVWHVPYWPFDDVNQSYTTPQPQVYGTLTPSGTRLELHEVRPQYPMDPAAGHLLQLRHGDGVTPYFDVTAEAAGRGGHPGMGLVLSDGLSAAGYHTLPGLAYWLISFRVLTPAELS